MAAPGMPNDGAQRARKPMYEDEHASCSVMLAKFRNQQHLLGLPTHDQFRWLHRFYLVLDRIAEQHRVYKLYGGPHGFMISTGVAEPDEGHAATLLRFSVHLLQAVRSIRLPGMAPLDMIMVLASGPASSGLLGTTSLTYQIVGRPAAVARELMDSQEELPFLITSGMHAALNPAVSAELQHMGSVGLKCLPGEREDVYTLARYAHMSLTYPGGQPKAPAAATAEVALPPAMPTSGGVAAAEQQKQQQKEGSDVTKEDVVDAVATAKAGVAVETEAVQAPAPAGVQAKAGQVLEATKMQGAAEQQDAQVCERKEQENAGPSVQAAGTEEKRGRKRLLQRLAEERRRQLATDAGVPGNASGTSTTSIGTPKKGCKGKPGLESWKEPAGAGSLPRNTASTDAWPASDLLMRFDDPTLEASFCTFNSESQQLGELAWLFLGLFTAVLYAVASVGRGQGLPLMRIAQFQLVPLLGAVLWRWRHGAYLKYREALWFVQRFLVLLATSLPTSFVFDHPTATPLFAFGLCNLGVEVVTRRMRLHLQLLSSLFIYVATLTLMSLHPEDSPAHSMLTSSYLSVHLLVTALIPTVLTAVFDYSTRASFHTHLREQLHGLGLHKL